VTVGLHLARTLVAVAERHVVAAQITAGRTAAGEQDGDEHQRSYDRPAARAGYERLALAYWRARRLAATVTALRADLAGGPDRDDPSGTAAVWDLSVHASAVADACTLSWSGCSPHPPTTTLRR
jgi:hypothetical protein